MRWSDVEQQQPRLTELGRRRILEPGVALVVTIRRDGTPRLSPVEPFLLDGGLWLSFLWQSKKADDLIRDPRILVHSVVTDRDGTEGEYKIRGVARAEHDLDRQAQYAEAVTKELGWSPTVGRFHLWEVEIDDIAYISYNPANGDQHVASWPPGREFIRRGTSATSVGAPEPMSELIQ